MITTTEIPPSPALAAFVRCYTFREFNTCGSNLIKPWNALHETSLFIFFKDKPVQLINPQTGKIIKRGHYAGVMGLATQYNGEMTFNGCYSMFEIIFKSHGFHELFRVSNYEIINRITDAEDIFDSTILSFFEQLSVAKGINEMCAIANRYLLGYLNKQKLYYKNNQITAISDLILKNCGIVSMDRLAYNANMSLRTFERHFIDQVGISPKLYSCITRFNHAFDLKLRNPDKDWTAIAHESGYFDQMHLIKDFKRFTGNTPSSFLKQTPLTEETFNSRVKI
ncbi:MAG: helix-turn-helix domain-containing protein [Chitinophagaceae bacterium]